MVLHTPTLFLTLLLMTLVAGALLSWSWWRTPSVPSLAWAAAAMFVGGVGVALVTMRGQIPAVLSIEVGNALVIGGYALAWCSIRIFAGRRPGLLVGIVASLGWIVACQLPIFATDLQARVVLASLIITGFSALAVWECLRIAEPLPSRYPLAICLAVHGGISLVRAIVTLLTQVPGGEVPIAGAWFNIVAIEGMIFATAGSFLLLSLAKERAEQRQREAARTDDLTGLSNRRAFYEQARRMLARVAYDGGTAAVVLFDLDRFKTINDGLGHAVGDEVLRLFASVAKAKVRPGDLVARLGGDEFAAVLVGADEPTVEQAVQRILDAFAVTGDVVAGVRVGVAASAGIAMAGIRHDFRDGYDIDDLLSRADRALYAAKGAGRRRLALDRIEAALS